MAYRADTEADQIVGGQFGQHFGVDVVVAERRLVALKAEPAQPRPDVHAPLPKRRVDRSIS